MPPSPQRAIHNARGSFLRMADVIRETGLSKTTIYRMEMAGNFPRRVRLSGRAMGWWSEDLDAWKAKRLSAPG